MGERERDDVIAAERFGGFVGCGAVDGNSSAERSHGIVPRGDEVRGALAKACGEEAVKGVAVGVFRLSGGR